MRRMGQTRKGSPQAEKQQATAAQHLLSGLWTGMREWPDSRMDSSVASFSTASVLSMKT